MAHKRRIRNPKPSSSASSIEPSVTLFPSKTEFVNLLAVASIAVSVAIGCNYLVTLFNRQPKPFCNSDTETDYYYVSDVCDPCPNHGICSEGKLECISGYKRYGRSCLEDGVINEMAKNLAKMVESSVCESYSQYLCKGVGKVWVKGDELLENIDNDNGTYLYAKQKAMEIVGNLLETRQTGTGFKELKCPDMLVEHYKPLSCSIRLWLLEHALFLVPCFVLIMMFGLMLQRVRQRHYLSVRAEELYEQGSLFILKNLTGKTNSHPIQCSSMLLFRGTGEHSAILLTEGPSLQYGHTIGTIRVCDILEETALTSRGVNGESQPWIVASWLRDHILTTQERRDPLLWKKVEELVQEDSRLDRYPKILKGEPKVVWEWQVEGSLRSSGKKKKDNVNNQKSSEKSNLGSNQDLRRLKHGEPLKC